ncbi:MAG: HIT family protein [Armatimonadetes bacterium]|nr:HIT family protein [Armatimonadota bacterium]
MRDVEQQEGCIFCDIVQGRAHAYRVAENELALAFLDINPFTEGHCLVVPKRHVVFWHELQPAELEAFFHLAHGTATRIMQEYRPDFVSIYARGRRVPHAHLFLIPAQPGDLYDRHFTALERRQETSPELEHLRSPALLARVAARLNGKGG